MKYSLTASYIAYCSTQAVKAGAKQMLQHAKRLTLVQLVIGAGIIYNLLLPLPTLSDSETNERSMDIIGPYYTELNATPGQNRKVGLPTVEKTEPRVVRTYEARVTYYASERAQTDGNPFITASGSHVHWGTVAANCLPFGTKIRIPDVYGDQIFTVEDRHSTRFGCGLVDVWTDYAPGHHVGNGHGRIEVLAQLPPGY